MSIAMKKIGELPIDEWCNYWAAGKDYYVGDERDIDSDTRSELSEASELISSLVGALTRISQLDYSRAAVNGAALTAVSIAKVALGNDVEYTESMIDRMFERGSAYTCNGSLRGCEGERFGGCMYHEKLLAKEETEDATSKED